VSAAAALHFQQHAPRARCGCKGPGAAAWLGSQGYRVPAEPNSAELDPAGVLVARLATSEFLVEPIAGNAARVEATRAELTQRRQPVTVYPVTRQDLVVTINGDGLHALLRQICSVDFAPLLAAAASAGGAVVLTSMVGVGVVAWPRLIGAATGETSTAVTLWCEPSYAHYFWNTLLEVGRDLGAVTTGSEQ
jgi:sarcosine oxidase subunit gamma